MVRNAGIRVWVVRVLLHFHGGANCFYIIIIIIIIIKVKNGREIEGIIIIFLSN